MVPSNRSLLLRVLGEPGGGCPMPCRVVVLQCVAVRHSMLQRIVVCCSVQQCVAVAAAVDALSWCAPVQVLCCVFWCGCVILQCICAHALVCIVLGADAGVVLYFV